jgi:hypothetical protein
MAHMIPDISPAPHSPGGRAEGLVYDALKDGLPDDYFVFHGLHYFDPEHAAQGEADFLVVHRERGMLVIECKGYGVRRTGTGQWVRKDDHGEKPLKESPFEQASRHKHQLMERLTTPIRQMVKDPYRTFPFLVGHSVAFPLVARGDINLPLDADRAMVMDAGALDDAGGWVERAMNLWQRKEHVHVEPLSKTDFKRFRQRVLYPKYQAVPSLGGKLAANERTFVRLTTNQCEFMEGLLHNPRMTVTGGAGTGKTVLATHAASVFAAEGHRVLFLCFTKALARSLWRSLPREDGEHLEIRHFHSLCLMAAETLGQSPLFPDATDREASAQFWNHTLPELLMAAIDAGNISAYDAIVVDEGQDFWEHWWVPVEALLKESDHRHLVIFADPAQDLFGRGGALPAGGFTYELRYNFRNTKQVARYAAGLADVASAPHADCPDGPEPTVQKQQPGPAGVAQIEALVKELTETESVAPEDIVILTPHSRRNSSLASRTHLAGLELADEPGNRSGRLLHTSIGAFKGLESPVVIVADLSPDDELSNPNARYVAASRATQVLFVFELSS